MKMNLEPEYGADKIPRHFLELSAAYLDGAERLCLELVTGTWEASYSRGQVCLWLAFHATELFLKGCIKQVSPEESLNTHSLGKLMVMFSTLLPNVPFEPPFDPEPVPADPKLMAAVLRGDALLHQQLCYPLDLSGAPWCGLRAFTPELFLDEITRLKSDIERISSIVFGENDD